MITKKIQDTEPIRGDEGTEIRQIFHPHNTLNGIRYSLAHSTI
ncbi:MAG: cupin domain-containing protein, partial [Thaumarchaeota archaeon]|nr:cupin domain-containing protein [Nitrososphaerota archaeon]